MLNATRQFSPMGRIAELTDRFLERKGATPWGLGPRSLTDQAIRFAPLVEVIDRESDGFTVNDLGCGFGDLHGFIRDMGLPVRGYRGHDVSETMLREAEARVAASDVEVVHSDRLDRPADYSFACGIFNTRFDVDELVWGDYMKAVVHNLDEHSTRGFAFNSLSTCVDYREPHLYYADPLEMFDYCRREVSPQVALLHDYPLWEWTVLVRRASA